MTNRTNNHQSLIFIYVQSHPNLSTRASRVSARLSRWKRWEHFCNQRRNATPTWRSWPRAHHRDSRTSEIPSIRTSVGFLQIIHFDGIFHYKPSIGNTTIYGNHQYNVSSCYTITIPISKAKTGEILHALAIRFPCAQFQWFGVIGMVICVVRWDMCVENHMQECARAQQKWTALLPLVNRQVVK